MQEYLRISNREQYPDIPCRGNQTSWEGKVLIIKCEGEETMCRRASMEGDLSFLYLLIPTYTYLYLPLKTFKDL